jgi:hypothetical protein
MNRPGRIDPTGPWAFSSLCCYFPPLSFAFFAGSTFAFVIACFKSSIAFSASLSVANPVGPDMPSNLPAPLLTVNPNARRQSSNLPVPGPRRHRHQLDGCPDLLAALPGRGHALITADSGRQRTCRGHPYRIGSSPTSLRGVLVRKA